MTSTYLASQAQTLESTAAVDPSQAQVAQIPLQSFSLPTFPEEAFKSGLGSLILTSDLPGLKVLTIYSQLIGGTTKESSDDAVTFIKSLTELQEVHLLDVFAPPSLFAELGKSTSSNLKLLEINYTYRHSDPKFLETIPSKEMVSFIGQGKELVGLTLSISAPDITDDEDDIEGTELGIRPVNKKQSEGVVQALTENGKDIVLLDLTMFELSLEEVAKVLDTCRSLKVIHITVTLEDGWKEVLDVLGKKEGGLEYVEVVGVPGESMVEQLKKNNGDIDLDEELLKELSKHCKELKALSLSILKVKMAQWVKDKDTWQKQ
ncbi:hypothetical protein F5884DRAFT_660471 [Xylogone sp. PMI_703]|nr:hypothetical protein F5884DRAFT_660471 [Xylogone sp. PMI_703]